MRKIQMVVVLLVAALVLVGCGGGSAADDFQTAVESMTADFNSLTAELQAAETAEEAAAVLDNYAAGIPEMMERFASIEEKYSEEELMALNEDEEFTEIMTNAYGEYQNANMNLFQVIGELMEKYEGAEVLENAIDNYFQAMAAQAEG
jgi:outer membrane murein-binding lipoprotein Lpp